MPEEEHDVITDGDEVTDVAEQEPKPTGEPKVAGEAEPSEEAESIGPSAAELEDRWRRALADLDNARKRHARELRREAEAERRRVCLAWLAVVDNLDLAVEHTGRTEQEAPLAAGVRAVRDQVVAVLSSFGYPRDEQEGVRFDPMRHEATGTVDVPGVAPGTVVKVLRPGYGEPPERQLRPAAVLVSRKQE